MFPLFANATWNNLMQVDRVLATSFNILPISVFYPYLSRTKKWICFERMRYILLLLGGCQQANIQR